MINGVRVKICGITSLVDAEAADSIGADYLGFILFPKSPRFISAEQYRAMKSLLPERRRVAVSVEPTESDLLAQVELGFEHFQIHFNQELPIATIARWSEIVGPDQLWLAPRLPPGADVLPKLIPYAHTFLLDTFHKDKMGGTGETGDWDKFKRHRETYSDKNWVLSGGLAPDNVVNALRATSAARIDVNSGVEIAPGVKSPEKLQALVAVLRARS
jgi:phosphoribosylanthranilate isomerase